jgi:hypothetical protein
MFDSWNIQAGNLRFIVPPPQPHGVRGMWILLEGRRFGG